MNPMDPLSFDRAVRSAAARGAQFLASLRSSQPEPAPDMHAVLGSVANREVLDFVRALPSGDPIQSAALRWMHYLIDLRVNAVALAQVAHAYRRVTHSVRRPILAELSPHGMVLRALAEPERRAEWLDALIQIGPGVRDASLLLWERRMELSQRMGFDSPQAMAPTTDLDVTGQLIQTQELLEQTGPGDLQGFLRIALASDASEGWPAQLNARTMTDFFREGSWFYKLSPRFGPWPAPVAPASFLRGFATLGRHFFEAAASPALPFSVAHDPYGLGTSRSGALFCLMGSSEAFLRRALGIGPDRARESIRLLAQSLLLETRVAALRHQLAQLALQGSAALYAALEEQSSRALGFALPRSLALVLLRPDVDAAQRTVGIALAATQFVRLRDEHDEDFFRNPRAAEQLRGEASFAPEVRVGPEQLAAGVSDLHNLLKERLR